MWYKKTTYEFEGQEFTKWNVGSNIKTPDGEVEQGQDFEDWKWHDEPPQEYLNWKENE